MYRRLTAIIVLVAFLAGQLATVPHAHAHGGDNSAADHDVRPHFHVGGLHRHSHEHAHERGHAHHHEHDHETDHAHSPQGEAGSADADHDSDAVYLADDHSAAFVGTSATTVAFGHAVSAITAPAFTCAPRQPFPIDFEFPDICRSRCPLYLILRALRI
jgi:hypothetical protein